MFNFLRRKMSASAPRRRHHPLDGSAAAEPRANTKDIGVEGGGIPDASQSTNQGARWRGA